MIHLKTGDPCQVRVSAKRPWIAGTVILGSGKSLAVATEHFVPTADGPVFLGGFLHPEHGPVMLLTWDDEAGAWLDVASGVSVEIQRPPAA